MLAAKVRKAVPAIDEVVVEYATGYTEHLEALASNPATAQSLKLNEEISFLHNLLLSAGGDSSAVDKLTVYLRDALGEIYKKHVNMSFLNTSSRKLDMDILSIAQKNKAMMSANIAIIDGNEVDLLAGTRKVASRVDRKKLEKQEKKIAAKIAKRKEGFMKELRYERSKLLAKDEEPDYDEFFLTVNPLDLGPSESKSKDVKLDNIDLHVGDGKRILSGASLTLAYGHRYGLVGSNGVGKSSLLKALSRREFPVPKHITILYVEQEVTGDEKSVLQNVLDADVWRKYLLKDEKRVQARLAAIQQERESLSSDDPLLNLLSEESDSLESNLNDIYEKLNDMESEKAEGRAAAILSGLGFDANAQLRATNSFSGGWRMRISLARALFCKPDLLMLDEPSNMLDIPSITYLSNYIRDYKSTLLIVSHDRDFLNETVTDIIHMHSERLDYYRGCDFNSFYATKNERFKNAKREYETQLAYRKHLQEFVDKFRYNAAKSQEAQSRLKKLQKLPILEEPKEEYSAAFRFPAPDKISPPVLQLNNLSFHYDPEKTLLLNVNGTINMDSRIALVGGNGCGKTTLLKLIMEQLNPTSGYISRHPRLRVGYFAQHHIDNMDLNLSAVEWMTKTYPGKTFEEYRNLLGSFHISGTLGIRPLKNLSGGQKSRVAFACLSLANPHILVLDEPSNHLDIAGLDALADALNQFEGGILMVSHDVTTIKKVCNEIWVCEDQKVERFSGTIDDYKKHILKRATGSGIVVKQ